MGVFILKLYVIFLTPNPPPPNPTLAVGVGMGSGSSVLFARQTRQVLLDNGLASKAQARLVPLLYLVVPEQNILVIADQWPKTQYSKWMKK